MVSRTAPTRNRVGNGRTPAENKVYAQIGQRGLTPDQRERAAAAMRAGRRRSAAERITARLGKLPPDELEREIDADIRDQMNRARAAALTARRKASEAADRAAQAEAALTAAEVDNLDLDATGLADCGSDGASADVA
jgi:hypothetical protein